MKQKETIHNSLAKANPELAKEWHPTKNGDLKPESVSAGSHQLVWWWLPYDDPKTGNHYDFEWQASPNNRSRGSGCPYLTNRAVLAGYNDLATVNPELAKEWHPGKNGDLTPECVSAYSHSKVWWLLPYDDPKTGKHFDFEWVADVNSRNNGNGCPFVAQKRVWFGFNDLATLDPLLAKEWHPVKNGNLRPENVMIGSHIKAWWLLSYDDPKTGNHFDFEWEAVVGERAKKRNCPFLTNHAVWKGFNDLATTNPELANEWHPTKNNDLKPTEVTKGSMKKVWWLFPYDDPKTGNHFDFEWEATVTERIKCPGCPFLTNHRIWKGYNDLATINPDLAKEWHPTKNGDLKPEDFAPYSRIKVWWLLPYDDPMTGEHFDFEWQAQIYNRSNGHGCPYFPKRTASKGSICGGVNSVQLGYNDLATKRPDIAKEWHFTKNGDLDPKHVYVNSTKQVWWLLPYDDPKTGKHFDFEWKSRIVDRVKNNHNCPFLTDQIIWRGYNDLATINPEVAKEWHPTKNGAVTAEDVLASSIKKVWWLLPYDDPETGKHFDFEWEARIIDRVKGSGCPFLINRVIWPGYNDLATKRPDLAKEWHPSKNGDLRPENVSVGSGVMVWWLLPYDDPKTGKHFDFEWRSTVSNRSKGFGCPYLAGQAVWKGYNDLASNHPEIAEEWHPTKNGDLKPDEISENSNKKVWWLLPYDDPSTGKHFDFEWKSTPYSRVSGGGCPFLSGKAVWTGFNDLATIRPDLAKEWHPIKNGNLKPEKVTARSRKKAWWLFSYCDPKTGKRYDFEWKATIGNRYLGAGCPFISESRGEKYVRDYFELHGIPFEYEKSFENLKGVGGSSLSYDFYIIGTNILVEYQGMQHYKPIDYFGGSVQFKKQKEHDHRKRIFALKNGYKLMEIQYEKDTFESVSDYLDNHLLPLLIENVKTGLVQPKIDQT